jgi:hypothetical protein
MELLNFLSTFCIHYFCLLFIHFCPFLIQLNSSYSIHKFYSILYFALVTFHPLIPSTTHEIHLHAGNNNYSPHQLIVSRFSYYKSERNFCENTVVVVKVGTSIMVHSTTIFSANLWLTSIEAEHSFESTVLQGGCSLLSAPHPKILWIKSMKLKSMICWQL